jgi:hypothetical protein
MCAHNYPLHLLASNHNRNMMTDFSTTQNIQFYEHPILLHYQQIIMKKLLGADWHLL